MNARRRLATIVLAAFSLGVVGSVAPPLAATADALSTVPASSISVGAAHACAITGGIVRCWGSNGYGQLGDGSTHSSLTPVAVLATAGGTPLAGAVAVAAGGNSTCALLSTGRVRCWGQGTSGQLGNGSLANRTVPYAVSGISTATAIAVGSSHACARLSNGTARCWGLNSSGQLGDGTRTRRATPVTVKSLSGATVLAAGAAHTCARLSSGAVKCWGTNASGQLGDGTRTRRLTAVTVRGVSGARAIAAGASHTCATVGSAGTVKCWGLNSSGQLGDGTTTRRPSAVTSKSVSGATSLAAGSAHTCARLSTGAVVCWGLNSSGQLGDGTVTRRLTRVSAAGLAGVGGIAAGSATSCVYLAATTLRCWGASAAGQVGDGSAARRLVPTPVAGLVAASVAAALAPAAVPNDGATTTRLDAIVRDAGGFPVAGVTVDFAKSPADDVALASASAVTGSTGVAVVLVTASTTPGANTLTTSLHGTAIAASATLEERSSGQVTFASSPGGAISPGGTASYAFGTVVPVTVTPSDAADVPSLLVDGAPLALAAPVSPATGWTAAITVTGVHHVSATFARLAPRTRILDAASGASLSSIAVGGTSVTFKSHTALLDSLAVGDILAAGIDSGVAPFLLRITAIKASGAGLVLTTVPADITEAITRASADLALPVQETVPAAAGPAVARASASGTQPAATVSAGASVTIASWGASVKASSGPLTAKGSVELTGPTIDVSMTLVADAFPNCPNAALTCGKVTAFKTGLHESASASVELSVGESYSKTWEAVLASHAFNSVVVLAGIPVPVTLSLDAGVGAKVDFNANLSSSATWAGTLGAGVEYIDGAGWTPYHDISSTFDFKPPTLAASGSIRGYPFFTATPALGFNYGGALKLFCGPFLKLEPGYVELSADVAANPWWSLDAGVSLSGGAQCSFGDPYTLGSVDLAKVTLAHAADAHAAVQVSAGANHACAVVKGGTVECWGSNASGELGDGTTEDSARPVAVLGITNATAVAAAPGHTCAVLADGTARCWGGNGAGELGNGTSDYDPHPVPTLVVGLSSIQAIATSGDHACALLSSGSLYCWGDNGLGELGIGTSDFDPHPTPQLVPALANVTSIAVGSESTCAVAYSWVSCWGANLSGELGLGYADEAPHPAPMWVSGTSGATSVSAGVVDSSGSMVSVISSHTCATMSDQTVKCWGSNWSGELGLGYTDYDAHPYAVTVPGVTTALSVTTGSSHTCVVLASGGLQCWGSDGSGELGAGWATAAVPSPTDVSSISTAKQVSAGSVFTCAVLLSGQLQCWGDGLYGQLGTGRFGYVAAGVPVSGLSAASVLAAGSTHTCAIVAGGAVDCWGGNWRGQLGLGYSDDGPHAVPEAVTGITAATRVAAGDDDTCVIVSGGVRCWGDNWSGQLGIGSRDGDGHGLPTAVTGISTATDVAINSDHACAVLSNGSVRCWGRNDSGQLGNGATTDSFTPVAVKGITTATTVAVGYGSTCVRVSTGGIKCWGDNSSGQLGNGTFRSSLAAVSVAGITTAITVAGGGPTNCARLSGGAIRCWGSNFAGELGRGTSDEQGGPASATDATPMAPKGITTSVALGSGGGASCVVLTGGSARCWGANGDWRYPYGEWQNPRSFDTAPVIVPGVSSATSVTAGGGHACARLGDGSVRCWGNNELGQLGDGSPAIVVAPGTVAGF
jgi:alpha-tubulin suppressor-like RCC1 family protein